MIVHDFEFDGMRLSDMGFTICNFSNSGSKSSSTGGEISFNTVKTLNGSKQELASAVYDECLQITFEICKNPCNYANDMVVSLLEYRKLMRWLNRKRFCEFRILDNEYADIYFEGSFNISPVEINGKLYGLELVLITNRPFAMQNKRTYQIKSANGANVNYTIYDESDEIGYIYPKLKITIKEDGVYTMSNSIEPDRVMRIENCVAGEEITIDYPIISSSVSSHNINEDFNWVFFRIANVIDNRDNVINATNSNIKLEYSPIAKIYV